MALSFGQKMLISLLRFLGPSKLSEDYLSTSYDGKRNSTGFWEKKIRILLASVLRWKGGKMNDQWASLIMINLGYKSYENPNRWKNFVNKERYNVNMNYLCVLIDVVEMLERVNELLITTKRSVASPQLLPLSPPPSSLPPLSLPPSVLSSLSPSVLASPRGNSDLNNLGSNNMSENKKAAKLGQHSSIVEQ